MWCYFRHKMIEPGHGRVEETDISHRLRTVFIFFSHVD